MIIMHWQSQNKKRRFSKLWTKQTKQNQDHDIAHCMDDEKTNESVLQMDRSNGNIHYPRKCEYGIRWDVDGGRMDEEWRCARAEVITTMYPYMSVGGCE